MRKIGEGGILKILSDKKPRTIKEIQEELDYKHRKVIEYHLISKSNYTSQRKSLLDRGLVEIYQSIEFSSKNPTYKGSKWEMRRFRITRKGLNYLKKSG